MCTKLLLYYHLPIKVPLSIIMSQKGRYGKLNLSIRIIGYTILITLLVIVVVVVVVVVSTTHTLCVAAKTMA